MLDNLFEVTHVIFRSYYGCAATTSSRISSIVITSSGSITLLELISRTVAIMGSGCCKGENEVPLLHSTSETEVRYSEWELQLASSLS